ncbi:MAG: L,D-transpeptidase family protein [Methylococcales bacterium]|nr:L,D-transpeptidase family protein [Methylococcales bacterium]
MLIRSIACLILFTCNTVIAGGFSYPENPNDRLIGKKPDQHHYIFAKHKETLLDIARNFDIGQIEILLANPTVDRWLPGRNTQVKIPNSRLLPDTPHEGIVLNLAEFRLYYYPEKIEGQGRQVITHPISIGRVDWETPLGKTQIIAKKKDPTWTPPESIRKEHEAKGDILPAVFPAGSDNPLGLFALRLGVPGYLIHGTNKPFGVGMQVSHGCIRMYPEDIEKIFPNVTVGTPVYIVNQPIKVGWSENILYVEVYQGLKDNKLSYEEKLDIALALIEQANNYQMPVIDGQALKLAIVQSDGVPVPVYRTNIYYH